MTQVDKELLLKDLCARLPYNVKVQHIKNYKDKENSSIKTLNYSLLTIVDSIFEHEELRPYLFPLSSMTEEQKKEYKSFSYHVEMNNLPDYEAEMVEVECATDLIDWYNENHFDYRSLIEKGLAIDCTDLNIY